MSGATPVLSPHAPSHPVEATGPLVDVVPDVIPTAPVDAWAPLVVGSSPDVGVAPCVSASPVELPVPAGGCGPQADSAASSTYAIDRMVRVDDITDPRRPQSGKPRDRRDRIG